jgi:hypothetical protein
VFVPGNLDKQQQQQRLACECFAANESNHQAAAGAVRQSAYTSFTLPQQPPTASET